MKTAITKFLAGADRFAQDEAGVTLIEYGLLAALIAVVSITAITTLGTTLAASWANITGALAGA